MHNGQTCLREHDTMISMTSGYMRNILNAKNARGWTEISAQPQFFLLAPGLFAFRISPVICSSLL